MFDFIKNILSSKKSDPRVAVSTSGVPNVEINPAREMLKEATALKKDKKYDEACEKLREAFSLEGADGLMVKERLRLPMYLQLANKNDEGWKILNEMNVQFTDYFSQAEIADQMRVFLQKEKKYSHAVLFAIWSICKEIERDRKNIQGSISLADQYAEHKSEWGFLSEGRSEEIYGTTLKGNPITDHAYKMFHDRVRESSSIDGVRDRIFPLLKKAKKEDVADDFSESVSRYLGSAERYDFREVRDIVNEFLVNE